MKKTASSPVETGLAELSGVQVCAGPDCHIILKSGQGKRTGVVKTCFQPRCVSWAEQKVGAS